MRYDDDDYAAAAAAADDDDDDDIKLNTRREFHIINSYLFYLLII